MSEHPGCVLLAVSLMVLGCGDGTNDVGKVSLIGAVVADGAADANRPYLVERTAGGGVVISASRASGLPMLLDSTGRLVGELGHKGAGPGELQRPLRIFAWHDSLLVQDMTLGRLSLFAPAGTFAHDVGSGPSARPLLGQAVLYSMDTLLVSARIGTEDGFGHPFHLLDRDGRVRKSWGAADRTLDPSKRADIRYLTRASDTTFWAAAPDRYEFELWTIGGRLIRHLKPVRDWFIPGQRMAGTVDRVRPPIRIASIATDSCGDLVVVTAWPRDDWAPTARPGVEAQFPGQGEYSRFLYQRIEVMTATEGRLVASTVIRDSLVAGFMSDGSPFGFVSDLDGRQLAVWWNLVREPNC